MDAMTMKMDTQYKEMQSRSNHLIPECDEDDKPMSPEAEAIFMKTFRYTFMDLKTKLETTTKNHQASIQNPEAKFDRFADKQSGRASGSLPSNTQPNPKGSSSKPYQPSEDEEESTPQPKSQTSKSIKETPIPKPYKPKIPYPQRLRKGK
ncbi:hypothetical protein Tco_1581784 [Tanacetum coccineum]